MKALIIILLVLTALHFVYESILLPGIRMGLRYKFYALRDELFNLKIENENKDNIEYFRYVESALNSSVRHIHLMNLSTILTAKEFFRDNPDIVKRSEEKSLKFDANASAELKAIYVKTININVKCFMANTFVLFILFLPIFLGIRFLRFIGVSIKSLLIIKTIQESTFIPEPVYHRFAHISNDELYC